MNERMSKYRHALGLLTGSTHYATAAVKYCTPLRNGSLLGPVVFHLPKKSCKMFPKTMKCVCMYLYVVWETQVFFPIIVLPRPLDIRYPQKSDLWLLERPFFTVSRAFSLITKQNHYNATTPAFNYTLVELLIQNWVKVFRSKETWLR